MDHSTTIAPAPHRDSHAHISMPSPVTKPAFGRTRLLYLCALSLSVIACFALPLYRWVRFALASDVYSYIILVPFISFYLVWVNKSKFDLDSRPMPVLSVAPFVIGALLLGFYWLRIHAGETFSRENYFAVLLLSLLALLLSTAFLFISPAFMRRAAFPLALLVFALPFPAALLDAIVTFLQHRSAQIAGMLFGLSGMPTLRHDTSFQLPGFNLEVAPECSGIRSTLSLFITSLAASYLLLRSPWRRAVLVLAVIPLALLRNALRVFTIGQLCVRVGPEMIDSPIHTHGGPLFFALSLVPFFLLLLWLRKPERKSAPEKS